MVKFAWSGTAIKVHGEASVGIVCAAWSLILPKQDAIKAEGTVIDILPNTMFRVKLQGVDTPVLATLSGRMRQNNIRVTLADRVELELSVYDLQRGRITRRL